MTYREEARPTLIDAGDAARLEQHVRAGAIVIDTLALQLAELVETRNPDRKLSAPERERAVAQQLAGKPPSAYGTWAHFPWSNRLVHLLPEPEFFELRTSRNRNKITQREQRALSALTLGVVGLSVGQATALTLALEGVGGTLRLADFDSLSLSNMNRLRAGVHEIGLPKVTIVARAIYELDPYARLELFPEGITDGNIERFLDGLDVLLEECDDLKMKVRLRELAQKRKIPVVMETSDRGMIDVERFDLTPERPLFHGLAGDLTADRLEGLSTYEKVPIVLAIVGATTMSKRGAASMVDIDATLKTWPQLASAVALGGALNTDTVRRIALGKLQSSGRFFVDFEEIVRDPAEPEAPAPTREQAKGAPRAVDPRADALPPKLAQLLGLAALAPSGGNCQPWRFRVRGDTLGCLHDVARSRSLLDFEHRATHVAFGALAENLRLGASALGVGLSVRAFPDPADPLLVCEATLAGSAPAPSLEDAALAGQITLRVTNRRVAQRVPLDRADAARLVDVARRGDAELRLVTDDARLAEIGEVLGLGDRLRFMSKVMHREMMGELRWTREEADRTRDGMELATLELTPTDVAAMKLVSDWSLMETLREVEGGQGLALAARKAIAGASAVGLLMVPTAGPPSREAYFRGGAALQRVWLTSTLLGYAFQPWSALTYLFARLEAGGEGFDARERSELTELRARYREVFALDASPRAEVLLFRLGRASPPSARSLRRPLADLLA